MKRWTIPLAVAMFAVGGAQVATAQGQGQGTGQGKGQPQQYSQYDDQRCDGEKNCCQKANNQGLTGDKRRNFLEKCFDVTR